MCHILSLNNNYCDFFNMNLYGGGILEIHIIGVLIQKRNRLYKNVVVACDAI